MMVDSPIKSPQDVAMATVTSPQEQHLSTDVSSLSPKKDRPATPTTSLAIPDVPMTSLSAPTSASNTPPDITMATECRSSPVSMGDDSGEPHPKHVSDSELEVLQDCLHRWRTEVENDVRGLFLCDTGLSNQEQRFIQIVHVLR